MIIHSSNKKKQLLVMRVERSLLIVESVLGLLQLTLANSECPLNVTTPLNNFDKLLSRKKRHLVFPKSTTFVITLTGLKAIQLKEPTNWNLDLELDTIWPIPNENAEKKKNKKWRKAWRKTHHRLRRHRRDLYNAFEMTLNKLGLPGKNCILRTICEAKSFLHPPGVSFVDDLLRVILSHGDHMGLPLDPYDLAYDMEMECKRIYNCPISLLQLFLNNDQFTME